MLLLPTYTSYKQLAPEGHGKAVAPRRNPQEGSSMSMVQWSEEYSVEIQEIDEQHKCIVSYINELYEALARKESRDIVVDVIHKLVQQALAYQGRYLAGDDKVGMELLMFLKEWLFTHINRVDKQYMATFHASGVKKNWLKKFW